MIVAAQISVIKFIITCIKVKNHSFSQDSSTVVPLEASNIVEDAKNLWDFSTDVEGHLTLPEIVGIALATLSLFFWLLAVACFLFRVIVFNFPILAPAFELGKFTPS